MERLIAEPGAITVVCTGPLTNLALALQHQARVAECAREVVFMGGAVAVPGNITPVAEYNTFADPEAAAIVCSAPWPLIMVGLDVTQHVVLTRHDISKLERSTTAEAVLLREVTRYPFDELGLDHLALHDPLAVGVAVDPSLTTTLSGPVLVETRGEYTRGQTIFDRRRRAPQQSSNTQVCMQVDAERFHQLFLVTLGLS